MLNKAKKRSKVPPGNLQMKRPRPSKSPPGGFRIELRGVQNGLLEASGRLLGICGVTKYMGCVRKEKLF